MRRIRLQIQILPWDNANTAPDGIPLRDQSILPWVEPCADEITLAELCDKIVTRFSNIHRGKGELKIKHLLDNWGSLLDLSLTVGEIFEDRSDGGSIEGSIVKVARFAPERHEQGNIQRCFSIAPDSSARPQKRPFSAYQSNLDAELRRDPWPTTTGWPQGFVEKGGNEVGKRRKLHTSREIHPDRPILSSERDEGRAIHQGAVAPDESSVNVVRGFQTDSGRKIPNSYGTPISDQPSSPGQLASAGLAIREEIRDSLPPTQSFSSGASAQALVDICDADTKSESPELIRPPQIELHSDRCTLAAGRIQNNDTNTDQFMESLESYVIQTSGTTPSLEHIDDRAGTPTQTQTVRSIKMPDSSARAGDPEQSMTPKNTQTSGEDRVRAGSPKDTQSRTPQRPIFPEDLFHRLSSQKNHLRDSPRDHGANLSKPSRPTRDIFEPSETDHMVLPQEGGPPTAKRAKFNLSSSVDPSPLVSDELQYSQNIDGRDFASLDQPQSVSGMLTVKIPPTQAPDDVSGITQEDARRTPSPEPQSTLLMVPATPNIPSRITGGKSYDLKLGTSEKGLNTVGHNTDGLGFNNPSETISSSVSYQTNKEASVPTHDYSGLRQSQSEYNQRHNDAPVPEATQISDRNETAKDMAKPADFSSEAKENHAIKTDETDEERMARRRQKSERKRELVEAKRQRREEKAKAKEANHAKKKAAIKGTENADVQKGKQIAEQVQVEKEKRGTPQVAEKGSKKKRAKDQAEQVARQNAANLAAEVAKSRSANTTTSTAKKDKARKGGSPKATSRAPSTPLNDRGERSGSMTSKFPGSSVSRASSLEVTDRSSLIKLSSESKASEVQNLLKSSFRQSPISSRRSVSFAPRPQGPVSIEIDSQDGENDSGASDGHSDSLALQKSSHDCDAGSKKDSAVPRVSSGSRKSLQNSSGKRKQPGSKDARLLSPRGKRVKQSSQGLPGTTETPLLEASPLTKSDKTKSSKNPDTTKVPKEKRQTKLKVIRDVKQKGRTVGPPSPPKKAVEEVILVSDVESWYSDEAEDIPTPTLGKAGPSSKLIPSSSISSSKAKASSRMKSLARCDNASDRNVVSETIAKATKDAGLVPGNSAPAKSSTYLSHSPVEPQSNTSSSSLEMSSKAQARETPSALKGAKSQAGRASSAQEDRSTASLLGSKAESSQLSEVSIRKSNDPTSSQSSDIMNKAVDAQIQRETFQSTQTSPPVDPKYPPKTLSGYTRASAGPNPHSTIAVGNPDYTHVLDQKSDFHSRTQFPLKPLSYLVQNQYKQDSRMSSRDRILASMAKAREEQLRSQPELARRLNGAKRWSPNQSDSSSESSDSDSSS